MRRYYKFGKEWWVNVGYDDKLLGPFSSKKKAKEAYLLWLEKGEIKQ